MPPEPKDSVIDLMMKCETAVLSLRTTTLGTELVRAAADVYSAGVAARAKEDDDYARTAARDDVRDFLNLMSGSRV